MWVIIKERGKWITVLKQESKFLKTLHLIRQEKVKRIIKRILCCHAGILKECNLLVYTYIVSSVVRLLRWQWVKNIYIKKEMESLTNTMIYVPHMETSRKNRKNTLLLSISERRYKALYALSYDLLFILTIIFWYVFIISAYLLFHVARRFISNSTCGRALITVCTVNS